MELRRRELNGRWVAVEANDDVRRYGIELDTDDTLWEPVTVPGHWRDTPKFAASDGPIMYRHRFTADPPSDGARRWITLDGIFYQADVWLDGAYLGDPEGYFFPHSFDVTALCELDDEHVLAIEATCAPQSGATGRRNITGVFQHWDGMDRQWNPGGIWRTVHLYDTGPVRLDRLRVLCRDADARRAHLRLVARLDSDAQRSVIVRTFVDDELHDEQTHVIASGENQIEWSVDIVDPALWWPRALGDQPLTDVAVEVEVDGQMSDRRERRTGLRQVTWDNWICSVNGERLFLKGANLLPTRAGLASADAAAVRRDLEFAVDLGLDVVRLHGHIADREVYRAADELGMLIMQDFPLQWGHARTVRGQAVDQARAAVDTLGHHPSIVQWTAHNDPSATTTVDRADWKNRTRQMMAHQLPSWNKSVLDRWVKRSFEKADSSRETVAHSGVLPHFPQLSGTDTHLWHGWHRGDAEDLAGLAARVPRLVRFVSEFGAHAPPNTAPFIDDELATRTWPDLDWDRLQSEFGYQRDQFERLFPPDQYASYEAWRKTTQLYQSHVLKTHIETLRRLKYRPSGGFCFYALADPAPVISASVLDHERVPKDAYAVVKAACASVLVVAGVPPEWVNEGDRLRLDVHLINDRREEIDFAVVDAVATWAGGEQRWRFGGPVPSDDVVKVGQIDLIVPDTLGELAFELTMTAGDITSHNRYTTAVTLPPGA
jgi:beta-mannosidase